MNAARIDAAELTRLTVVTLIRSSNSYAGMAATATRLGEHRLARLCQLRCRESRTAARLLAAKAATSC